MQAKKNIVIAFFIGILTSCIRTITYGNTTQDPEPFDFKKKTQEWSFCNMTDEQVSNNKREESRSYVEMKIQFINGGNYGKNTTKEENQFSNFRNGVRRSCNGKEGEGAERFNNINWQFKQGSGYGLTPTGTNTNGVKTEEQCYKEFLNFAQDEKNYTSTKNPYLQKNRFETFMQSNKNSFTSGIDTTISGLIFQKIRQGNREKTIKDIKKNIERFAMLYEAGSPTPLTFEELGKTIQNKQPNIQKLADILKSISKQKEMTNSDIRRLQLAINTLGCDKIKTDGALGNYTIKSFCVCFIAKPEEKCISVLENTNNLGTFMIKDSTNTIINNICETLSNQKTGGLTTGDLFCTLKNQVTRGNTRLDTGQAVGFCCIGGLSVKEVSQKVYSCCIDPTKKEEVAKCKNQDAIKNATKCGPKENLQCQLNDNGSGSIEVPFCPCPNGESRVKKPGEDATSFKCPCVNPSECIKFYSDLSGQNEVTLSTNDTCGPHEGAKAKYCKTKENGPIKEICPCPDSPDKNWEKIGDKEFKCPCPINNPTDLTSKCDQKSLENKTTISPGETCVSKEDPKKNLPICYCDPTTQKGYIKKNGQWICDDCKPGTKRDQKKEKCVCDQSYAAIDPNHCCGIKLNTNVPRIGRCILFGNTNNKDRDWTNTYGNGNTTITVNVLNAFPLLMGALGKILLTVILLAGFGMIIRGGVQRATGNEGSRSGTSGGKAMIAKVAIGLALIGASGVILHAINPNFFQ